MVRLLKRDGWTCNMPCYDCDPLEGVHGQGCVPADSRRKEGGKGVG